MNLTLETLIARVAGAIGLDDTSGSDERALIVGWLNEGQEQFLLETKIELSIATMDLTIDEGDYEISADILSIDAVFIDDEPLIPTSRDEIDYMRRTESSITDTTYYAMASSNMLMVYPAPSAATTLTIRYVAAPTAMVDDGSSDVPDLPAPFMHAPEIYAKWKAAEYDDKELEPGSAAYFGQWQLVIRQGRAWKNRIQRRRSPFVPGSTRRRRFPQSPGVDWR